MAPRTVRGSVGVACAILALGPRAQAARPLITDDAATVGRGRLQLETWAHADRDTVHHTAVAGFGAAEPLELSLAIRHGLALVDRRYSVSGGLAQAKWLLVEGAPARYPGLALVAGAASPFGNGRLASAGWEVFGYAAVTFATFDDEALTVHGNLGFFRGELDGGPAWRPTWGMASLWRVVGGLSAAVEIASGDPYAEVVGGIAHGGFRYRASDRLQLDLTVGNGLWGRPRMGWWATAGVRVAFGQ